MDKPSNYRRKGTRQTRLSKCPPTAWFAGRAELTWSEIIVDDTFPSFLEAAAGGDPADLVEEDSFMEQRQDQVRALIEQGSLKEADRLCQEGLARCPGHAMLWELLAGIEEARGNTEAAERTRNAAIEANREMRHIVGDHPALDAVEVMLLGKAGRLEETAPPIQRLQEAGFDQPIYWNMLGGDYYKNQRFLEARRAFERAYAMATDDGMRELALQGLALLVDLRTNFLERCRAMGADPMEALQQGGDEESVRFVREVLLAGDLATPLESAATDPSDPAFRPEKYWPFQNPLPDDGHTGSNKPPTVSPARLDAIVRFLQTSEKFAELTRKELLSHLQRDPELPLALDMYRWSRLRFPVLDFLENHSFDEPRIHGRWRRYKRTPAKIQDFERSLQIVIDNPTVNGEDLLALLPNRPELWGESIANSYPEQAKPSSSGAGPSKTKSIYSQPFNLEAFLEAKRVQSEEFKQAMAERELKRQKDFQEAATNPEWLKFKRANKKPNNP